jgi:class 3 adenylate cyclase
LNPRTTKTMKFFFPYQSGIDAEDLFREFRAYVQDATGWPIACERIFSVEYFDGGVRKTVSVGDTLYGGDVKCILASDLVLVVCTIGEERFKAPILIDRRDVVNVDWFEDFSPVPLNMRRSQPGILPSGQVAFLSADIAGGIEQWDLHPEHKSFSMVLYDSLMQNVVQANHGHLLASDGHSYLAAFQLGPDALHAALDGQLTIRDLAWPEPIDMKVRMAIHLGHAELDEKRFAGATIDQVTALREHTSGGQVLVSDMACDSCVQYLPRNATLKLLGTRRIGDHAGPTTVFQLAHPRLPSEFYPQAAVVRDDSPKWGSRIELAA